jgi:hypothetical protein
MRREGVLYPVSGPLSFGNGHFPVPSAFAEPASCEFVPPPNRLRPANVSRMLSNLARTRAPRLIVLSAEHFSSRLLRPGIERLAEAVAPLSTRILFYVRRQDELAVSAHSTFLSCGGRHRFDPAEISLEMRYFNHLTVADDWAAVFGRENVELRSFDRLEHGIEADFLEALDIEGSGGFAPVEPANRQISLQEAAILYALNQHLADGQEAAVTSDGFESFQRSQMLRQHVLGIAKQELTARTSLRTLLTPELRATIMTTFAESNRRLAAKYGVQIPDDIPPPSTIPNAELDPTDLLACVLARSGHEILDLEQRLAAMKARTLEGRIETAKRAVKRCLHMARTSFASGD